MLSQLQILQQYLNTMRALFTSMAPLFENQEILMELKAMRKDLDFIKSHIEDIFLSPEDEAALEEAEVEYRAGKSISLDELEKEIGL